MDRVSGRAVRAWVYWGTAAVSVADFGWAFGQFLLCWATGYCFGVGLYSVRKILEGSGGGI